MRKFKICLVVAVALFLFSFDIYISGIRIWRCPAGQFADFLRERREQRRGRPWE